jgi:hypothetical protein
MGTTARTTMRTRSAYQQRVLTLTQKELERHFGKKAMRALAMDKVRQDQTALRAYPGLEQCDPKAVGGYVHKITEGSVTERELREAESVKLAGEEIVEDAAAGEATRLGLGTKYLLTPQRITEALTLHNLRNPKQTIPIPVSPQALAPISIGVRHKLQSIYDLTQLASSPQFSPALNPKEVLKSQFSLTVLNEDTELAILRETARLNHFGLIPEQTLFAVQEKGLGMNINEGNVLFDPQSEWRLWNHGDMKIQQILEGKIFWVRTNSATGELERIFIKPEDYEDILSSKRNLISYPIEDIDYLTRSIDLHSLAVTLRLGEQGARMTMEAVAQQVPPQKGGFFTFDPQKGKVVCIESDSGGDVVVESDPKTLARIEYLNKNFNSFPNPVEAFRALASLTSFLHLTVKGEWIYPQIPQGDQNFNLDTSVLMWDPVKPIRNFKTLSHGAPTLLAMEAQDKQPGFMDLAKELSVV